MGRSKPVPHEAAATKGGPGWRTYAKVVGAFVIALVALALVPGMLTGEEAGDVFWFSVIATTLGSVCLYGGFAQLRERQLVRNTPTSKVRSLAVGDVEVKGRARPVEEPLVSPLTRKEACVYEFEVEEEHEDDDGSDWHTVLQVREEVPFEVDDGTGRVLVDAEEPDLDVERERRVLVQEGKRPPEPVTTWARETGRLDPEEVDGDEGLVDAVGDTLSTFGDDVVQHLGGTSLHDRRYTENVLAVDEETYVFGAAKPRDGVASAENAENLVIRRHEGTGAFILSDRSESQLVQGKLVSSAVFLALALFLIPTGVLGFLSLAGAV